MDQVFKLTNDLCFDYKCGMKNEHRNWWQRAGREGGWRWEGGGRGKKEEEGKRTSIPYLSLVQWFSAMGKLLWGRGVQGPF